MKGFFSEYCEDLKKNINESLLLLEAEGFRKTIPFCKHFQNHKSRNGEDLIRFREGYLHRGKKHNNK